MANAFDQFDTPTAAKSPPAANPFDQFDTKSSSAKNPFDQFEEAPSGAVGTFGKAAAEAAISLPGETLKGVGLVPGQALGGQMFTGEGIPSPAAPEIQQVEAAKPQESPIYQLGRKMTDYAKTWGPTEKERATHPIAATAGSAVGSIAGMAPALLGGPEAGLAMGMGMFAASGAGSTYDEAKAKGADDTAALHAAGFSALGNGALGALPLHAVLAPIRAATPGLTGWALSTLEKAARAGLVFAGVGEAQEFVGRQIAKQFYDPKAGYSPDINRVLGNLLGGGLIGAVTPRAIRTEESKGASSEAIDAAAKSVGVQAPTERPLDEPQAFRYGQAQGPPEAMEIYKGTPAEQTEKDVNVKSWRLQRRIEQAEARGDKVQRDMLQLELDRLKDRDLAQEIEITGGADVSRLASLLSSKLYGDPSVLPEITIKEMMQNSFDAIKDSESFGKGRINLETDHQKRTIAITDNGVGMDPGVLGKEFLQIAGTKKTSKQKSGGLGIAKMLVLYENKALKVYTLKNGVLSTLHTSGPELRDALDVGAKKPSLSTERLENLDAETQKLVKGMFPEGHGTRVEVEIPRDFTDASTGEKKEIEFQKYISPLVLHYSPLFRNIEVVHNRSKLPIGTQFPFDKFTQFANANFAWGKAKIYVTKDADPSMSGKWGHNLHVLSNGLWQFSGSIKKNPLETYGDNIPRTFYLDLQPEVEPHQPGYPFDLNRQRLTIGAQDDMNKIFNYISKVYREIDFGDEAKSFGKVQYLTRNGPIVQASEKAELAPEIPLGSKKASMLKAGDSVEVKDGQLIVNGKQVPELTKKDLEAENVDFSNLKIPQDKINPDRVMLHDNVEIQLPKDAVTGAEGEWTSLVDYARKRWGPRFNNFMFEVGNVFKELRDAVVDSMDEPGYTKLREEAIGISFDEDYRGVSIRVPFRGSFLNIARPEYTDGPRAALGYYGTMIHELAHFRERSHDAAFPAEMQRLIINTEPVRQGFIDRLMKAATAHEDIIQELSEVLDTHPKRAVGNRFKDSSAESRGPSGATPDLEESRRGAKGAKAVFGRSRQGAGGPREEQEPQRLPGPTGRAIGAANRGALIEDEHGRAIVNGYEVGGLTTEQVESVTRGFRLPEKPSLEDLTALLNKVPTMPVQDRARTLNWIDRQRERAATVGEMIENECLSQGGFTIR